MSNLSNAQEIALLNATLRGVNYTAPTAIFISLHTASPGEANATATEVTTATYGGYARQSASGGGAVALGWAAPTTTGTTSNALAITFPQQGSATPVTITHLGIYDALTGGNLLLYVPLTTPKTLNQTDSLTIPPGQITVTFE